MMKPVTRIHLVEAFDSLTKGINRLIDKAEQLHGQEGGEEALEAMRVSFFVEDVPYESVVSEEWIREYNKSLFGTGRALDDNILSKGEAQLHAVVETRLPDIHITLFVNRSDSFLESTELHLTAGDNVSDALDGIMEHFAKQLHDDIEKRGFNPYGVAKV